MSDMPDAELAEFCLNPDMHVRAVTAIAVTADGRRMVTGGADGTLKLWTLPQGELVRTMRPPRVDEERPLDLMVRAVAIDPAGRWAAGSGFSSDDGLENDTVAVFDVDTGRIIARLSGLTSKVVSLAVSPDGAVLAAGLGAGMRVWRVPPLEAGDWELIFAEEKSDIVAGLAFARSSDRLARTSFDGDVRLYALGDGGCREVASATAPGGPLPSGVSFSPDGRRLAVGYVGAFRVDLLDAETLAPAGQANLAGLAGHDLSVVTFLSGDGGTRLAAAGFANSSPDEPETIFVWDEAGASPPALWAAAEQLITRLAPLPDGTIAFGACDPAWGVLAADGRRVVVRSSVAADMRGKDGWRFQVSADGRRVWFGLRGWTSDPVLFDLDARRLDDAPLPRGLAIIDTTSLALKVGDRGTLTLGGDPVRLSGDSLCCFAAEPGGKRFVVGTNRRLLAFGANGEALWEQRAPADVCGVAWAPEAGLAVAAYGDGTIRWHDPDDDGRELLALFVYLPEGSKGPREWVLFTPNHQYDASSSDAERIIGWRIDRGSDEAPDVLPVEAFAAIRRRPDQIDAALSVRCPPKDG